jgi:hypothetical protein
MREVIKGIKKVDARGLASAGHLVSDRSSVGQMPSVS